MDNLVNNEEHKLVVVDRQTLNISGVLKIESFDAEEFLLKTNMGNLGIKGSNLEIIKLDLAEKKISIKGIINTIVYLENLVKEKKEGLIKKLFK